MLELLAVLAQEANDDETVNLKTVLIVLAIIALLIVIFGGWRRFR
jgi:hypothetical protein